MKNAKRAFSLLISAAALVSIASCGSQSVTSKKGVLVNYETVDKDGKTVKVDYTTNDLLIDYLDKDTTTSVQEYYDIAYEAVVKKYFHKDGNEEKLKSIQKDAKLEVKGKKDLAEKNAKEKKTKYEDEWRAILDSELSELKKSRRTEAKLREKYEVAKMKEEIGDIYYDTFKTHVKSEDADQKLYNIFWGENGYLNKRLPYHVKHILIKNTAVDGALYNGAITAEEAKDLSRIIGFLANGESFGDIASSESQDEGSKKLYGDLGIMDTATSFVNEFKLSAYIYDTLFNTNPDLKLPEGGDPFNIGEDNLKFFKKAGIAKIPYQAVEQIGKLANVEEDEKGKKVNEGSSLYFPRNILFNKYFNNHNFAFITAENSGVFEEASSANDKGWTSAKEKTFGGATRHTGTDGKEYYTDVTKQGGWTNVENETYKALPGFQEIEYNVYDPETGEYKGTDKTFALCDGEKNPLLVVRAGTSDYQGLHLISIERSALVPKTKYKAKDKTEYVSTLENYYAAINPFEGESGKLNENFPKAIDENGVEHGQQKTYINQLYSTYNTYNQRVNTLKNTIKNFDPSYDKKVFQWLKNEDEDFKDSNIEIKFGKGENQKTVNITEKIDKFVKQEINEHNATSFKISSKTWEGYRDYIENQQKERYNKLIPEVCALTFESGNGYHYVCHYSKEK